MPGYKGTGQATLIRDNQQIFLFHQEADVTGTPSIALQIERINRSYYPWGVSFQLYFTDVNGNPANPGTFEVDIQTSDLDEDSQYCVTNAWAGTPSLNASFAGRIELPSFYAKYIRAFIASLGNPVYINLLATH
jgi:hypothetical protein